MGILDDDKFAIKLLEEVEHIRYGLKYYIDKSNRLETELDYYKNAYGNRVNEYLEKENSNGK